MSRHQHSCKWSGAKSIGRDDEKEPGFYPKKRAGLMHMGKILETIWTLRTTLFSILWPTLAVEYMRPGRRLRKTAYLDGMRGCAALMVYWTHHELWAHDTTSDGAIGHIFEDGFGHNGHYAFVALPLIRVLFGAGHYAVALFFVISGYSLCWKPLSLIHAGEDARLLANVSAAMFKRSFRLFLPLIGTTYVYMILVWLFNTDVFPARAPTFVAEMKKLSWSLVQFTSFWPTRIQGEFGYNLFAWSLLYELRGSFVAYTALIVTSRFKTNARLVITALLIWYFVFMVDGWAYALFLSGMLLCDLNLLTEEGNTPEFLLRFRPWSSQICYAMFVFSLYIGGMPYHKEDIAHLRGHWGWYYISFLTPAATADYKWFYMFWAAVPMVAATPHIPWLRKFFESRFCQYLGKVSFGFYLVHGPVLWSFGNRLFVAVGFARDMHEKELYSWLNEFPLPHSGPLGLDIAFLGTQVVLLPLTLWMGEIITKLFDEPSVKIPQQWYNALLRPPKDSGSLFL